MWYGLVNGTGDSMDKWFVANLSLLLGTIAPIVYELALRT